MSDTIESIDPFERIIDDVKTKAYYLAQEIDKKDITNILTYSTLLISELNNNSLTIDQYGTIFTIIFDELHFTYLYMKNYSEDELLALYNISQNNEYVLIRLYLMTIVGRLICEKNSKLVNMIILDIMKFSKGIKIPIKGLYFRYFYIKQFKDIFKVEENIFIIESLLFNFEQVCILWNKLGGIREKEQCKGLVGESIFRIANLENLSINIYTNFILTKLLDLILCNSTNKNDNYVQGYLLDCIIHAFPIEMNLKSINSIFSAASSLKSIFLSNQFIINFLKRITLIEKQELLVLSDAIENYMKLNHRSIKNPIEKEIISNIELNCSVIRSFKNYANEENIDKFIFKCLNNLVEILNSSDLTKNSKIQSKLFQALLDVLNSQMKEFNLSLFSKGVSILDDNYKIDICLTYLEKYLRSNRINNENDYNDLFTLIKPIINKINTSKKSNFEESVIAKLPFIVENNNLQEKINLIKITYESFLRENYNSSSLYCSILNISIDMVISQSIYENNPELKGLKTKKITTSLVNLSIIKPLFLFCKDIILKKLMTDEKIGFDYYIYLLSNICIIFKTFPNNEEIKELKLDLNETIDGLIEFVKQNNSFELIEKFSNLLFLYKMIIDEKTISAYYNSLFLLCDSLNKRSDQTKGYIHLLRLNLVIFEEEYFNDKIEKLFEYSEYALMISNANIILMIDAFNLLVFLVNKYKIQIKLKHFEKLIKKIRNIIKTIKEEDKIASSSLSFEDYFNSTLEYFEKYKEKTKI